MREYGDFLFLWFSLSLSVCPTLFVFGQVRWAKARLACKAQGWKRRLVPASYLPVNLELSLARIFVLGGYHFSFLSSGPLRNRHGTGRPP